MNGRLTAHVAVIVVAIFASTTAAFGTSGRAALAKPGTTSIMSGTALAKHFEATGSPRGLLANSASFTDAAADSGPGPDIIGVNVSSDDAGMVTFQVVIPNRPTVPASLALALFVDGDSNPSTGDVDVNGAEYLILATGNDIGFGRWNGSDFDFASVPASLTASWSSGPVITLAAAELGSVEKFQFWVLASDNLDDPANVDAAPEIGQFPYELDPVPEVVGIAKPGSKLVPKPGKLFSALGFKLELDNGDTVAPDERTCVLKIAGKVVKPLAVGCKWRIPAAAAGKRGVLTLTLTYGGVTLAEKFPLKVSR
jgi:hypothetical protein